MTSLQANGRLLTCHIGIQIGDLAGFTKVFLHVQQINDLNRFHLKTRDNPSQ